MTSLTSQSHISVLKDEVVDVLLHEDVRAVFDGTLGLGGHGEAMLQAYPGIELYIATDADSDHLAYATKRLEPFANKIKLIKGNFSEVERIIEEVDPPRPMAFLFDLGIASPHVDEGERGFSYEADGPLDMRFDTQQSHSAEKLINNGVQDQLADIFHQYGEEPAARKIARAIIQSRKEKRIKTTRELREVIEGAVHPKERKKSVVRVFQALRIAVNREIDVLEKILKAIPHMAQSGDRVGIMSYHSLEDRLVKKYFKQYSQPVTQEGAYSLHEVVRPAEARLLTKKPITPTDAELGRNPRSRSVKFRILEKI